jgi:hypothetical protein
LVKISDRGYPFCLILLSSVSFTTVNTIGRVGSDSAWPQGIVSWDAKPFQRIIYFACKFCYMVRISNPQDSMTLLLTRITYSFEQSNLCVFNPITFHGSQESFAWAIASM